MQQLEQLGYVPHIHVFYIYNFSINQYKVLALTLNTLISKYIIFVFIKL